jgi:N-acetylglucosaminyl-diphospho-decaprenol L-rhamnosyltransferase
MNHSSRHELLADGANSADSYGAALAKRITREAASRLAVVIINYNTRDHLRRCLDSLGDAGRAELVVVDDGSSDGSVAMVREEYPHVRCVANGATASGYGAAANRGVGASQAPYVLLLNSDTILPPGAIATLSCYLDRHPRVGIAGPRLANPDGSLQVSTFPYPEPMHMLIRETSLLHLVGLLPVVRDYYLLTWPHDGERNVPWVLGAALLIRREAFEAVGGFDAGFYMYSEEVDLCYRVARAGWQVRFTPEATIVHVGGASVNQMRAEMTAQLYRSRLRFYRQHYSLRAMRLFKLILTYFMLRNLIRDLVRQRFAPGGCADQRLSADILIWKRVLIWLSQTRVGAPAANRRGEL